MKKDQKTVIKPDEQPFILGGVSRSLSVEDVKYLLFYGKTKEKTAVIDNHPFHLDYVIDFMFTKLVIFFYPTKKAK
jgi:hypothetical protein